MNKKLSVKFDGIKTPETAGVIYFVCLSQAATRLGVALGVNNGIYIRNS